MIRRVIHTGTARMHKCTRGCVVLFRGATGVGTHGLPTRSRVSDLTGRVIDAAISPAAPRRSLCRRCSISRAFERLGFIVCLMMLPPQDIYPARSADTGMPSAAARLERKIDREREREKLEDESLRD